MHVQVDDKSVFAATGGRQFEERQPVVVMLHGAGMDHIVWALSARSLAHRGRSVLAVDLPGHGRSEGPALSSIAAMASWVIGLLDAARIHEAALVGHSMGSLIALEAAAQAPKRVRRLAMLGVASRMPVHPDLLKAATEDRPHAADLIVSWAHGPAGHFGGNPAPGLWRMGGAQRLLNQAEEGVLARDLAACDAYDPLAAAGKVKCPSLLLLGALDRMTPASKAKALGAALPDGRTILIPGAGHMMMSETPDAVIDALLDFA
jgi:pimeloyl-ACP methyl ester carboxylesterase